MASIMSSSLLRGLPFAKDRLKEIGLIPNVIQKEIRSDWRETLRKVAEIGYNNLEFENFRGVDPKEIKSFLKEINLKPLSSGSVMAQMNKEDLLKKMIDDALFMEKKYLICYWPWRDGGENKKLDDFKKTSEDLNRVGELCKQGGIQFAYHNHDKEFVPVDGYQWGYEVFLNETDPKLVKALLDLYWITKAGGDPISMFEKFPGRFELLHVKDMDNTDKKMYTCPGSGVIDFGKIFSHAGNAGVKHYIVEIDRNDQPMDCIKSSYTYLKALRF
jgi:sugar phosphate isomerase/epimerase